MWPASLGSREEVAAGEETQTKGSHNSLWTIKQSKDVSTKSGPRELSRECVCHYLCMVSRQSHPELKHQ